MVEWIEMTPTACMIRIYMSPPSWWSGLKLLPKRTKQLHREVSTLVVEWIEISAYWRANWDTSVSTLVVEWIEIKLLQNPLQAVYVSTLVVEWIEMYIWKVKEPAPPMSPPSWWSGLKSDFLITVESME